MQRRECYGILKPMPKTHKRKTILILGAGFAGLAAALTLEKLRRRDEYNVILVDKNCYHLYHALLYEVATAAIDITEPDLIALQSGVCIRIKALQDIFLKKKINVMQEIITGIDLADNRVKLEQGGEVMYDALIFALGSQSNDFHIPGLAEHSISMKELPDALAIHLKIDALLRRAGAKGRGKIVIGGGGVSGVEVAGELRHYLLTLARQGRINPTRFEVNLIEAGPTLLPGMTPWVQANTMERLRDLGVTVRVGEPITSVDDQYVRLKDGTTHGYDLFVWSGGIQGHELVTSLGVPLIGKRQVGVTNELSIPGHDNVYVIGDAMFFIDDITKRPVPQVAQVAIGQGRQAARNIVARSRGLAAKPYRPSMLGYVFPVGGRWAISTVGFNLKGWPAWVLRKLVDLKYFLSIVSFTNALRVWYRGGRAYLTND